MYALSYKELHHEHLTWLSEVKFWQEEIRFLEKLCRNIDGKAESKLIKDCLNRLAHHQRLLKGMEEQITSHENFIREMIQNNGSTYEEDALDHDHNREHMQNFHESFKKLKKDIYKIGHGILV